ncbi:sensor histidine kinase [Dinghuibacter silviterrae]|uniref:Histidine kinase/DNA gyrase B/HSP90-like ATPase n=1 Tax=Dinghuibacter silviterrae TaxID=1539049 RepID=A0A4R8DIH5_9BACT|nr:sensor histidine kinase [Dinghuibacter silviterrae]TDW97375.1 histidine kinase/DNA gyrase B/HSP90-like ATPase [Dinghuibacter silviterrae]
MKRFVRIALVCCLLANRAIAQPLAVVRRLGFADGLADHAARHILQDKFGFIWIATDNGLQQFDGYRFTTYHHIPGDSTTIPSDQVTKVWALSDGMLLLATAFQGFCLFNPFTGKVIPMRKDPLLAKVDYAFGAAEDGQGNLWLTGQGALLSYRLSDGRCRSFDTLLKGRLDHFVGDLFFDAKGRLWISGAADGVFVLDPERGQLFGYGHNPDHLALLDQRLSLVAFYMDREQRLWVAQDGGRLLCYDIPHNRLTSQALPRGTTDVRQVLEDHEGRVWVFTGSFQLIRNATVWGFAPDRSPQPAVPYEALQVMEDKEGLFWMASQHGIDITDPRGSPFTFHSADPFGRFPGNPKETVTLFQSREGEVWLTSYGGGFLEMGPDLVPRRQWLYPAGMGDSSSRAWAMEQMADGRLWISCQHAWMSVLDPRTGHIETLRPDALEGKTVVAMTRGGADDTWLGLYDGLAYRDGLTGRFRRVAPALPYRGFTTSGVTSLWYEPGGADARSARPGGTLWVGTNNMGLQRFDPASGRYLRQYEPPALSSALITCIAPIDDSTLAVGTATGGINFLNKNTGKATYLTAGNGLPSNNILAVDAGSPGYLWVATPVGICRIREADRRVTVYDKGDGLGQEILTGMRFCRLRDGRMLLGCKGGFYSFAPDSMPVEDPPPGVFITALRLEDRTVGMDALLPGNLSVTLPYDRDEISIDYVSPDYLKTSAYFYELSGYDRDWVSAGMDRSARYHHLPAGRYTFRVRCQNQEGLFGGRVGSFELVVLPPFWKTAPFLGLCGIVLVTVASLLYLGRIRRIKARQALRNRIAADLHDDIGSSLSGINIYSRMALHRLEDAPGLLNKISDRSEKMVEALSDIVWSINSRNDQMEQVVARMKEYAADMLEPQLIHYSIEIHGPVERLDMDMADRKEFYLIYKEALNNAVKYAGCTRVHIVLRVEEHKLVMSLRDNGSGFDPAAVAQGNGLANMRARAKKLRATIELETGLGLGTVVTLTVPKR